MIFFFLPVAFEGFGAFCPSASRDLECPYCMLGFRVQGLRVYEREGYIIYMVVNAYLYHTVCVYMYIYTYTEDSSCIPKPEADHGSFYVD